MRLDLPMLRRVAILVAASLALAAGARAGGWRSLPITPKYSWIKLELSGGTSETAPGKLIVNG